MAKQRGFVVCLLLFFSATTGSPLWAALGGNLGSIDSDGAAMRAGRHTTRASVAYVVHEISNSAIQVREYVNASGQIFAVAWSGKSDPDLKPLLGNYFEDFRAALLRAAPLRRRIRVPGSRVVGDQVTVEKWGRLREIRGRSYVRGLLPAGVSVDEIR